MIVLDGVTYCGSDPVVDPRDHTFIGVFRPPEPPKLISGGLLCPCEACLRTDACVREHWMEGHFDVFQYRTITWPEPIGGK